jgi:hypothetical protein
MSHRCSKSEVEWAKEPDLVGLGSGDGIQWHGTCSCGRKVYEVYHPGEDLFDAESHEEV